MVLEVMFFLVVVIVVVMARVVEGWGGDPYILFSSVLRDICVCFRAL